MNREIRGLHEAAYLLALFAFLSQLLALLRDRTFAHFFGTGGVLDAYFAAFRVPDLVYAFLTLFVSSFALIPLLATRGGPETKEARRLVGSVLLVFGVVSIGISTILFFFMPFLVPFLFPGFSESVRETTITLSRIILLQPFFLGVSSVIGAQVTAARKFFIFALAPIFYNVGIIVGVLFLYPLFGVVALGWGVVLGAFLHFGIQMLPFLTHRAELRPHFDGQILQDTWGVVARSLPRSMALSANQILMLALLGAASLSAAGSVAALSFAWNLQSVPLSVVGVSYAAALFPSLAILFAKGEHETFISEVWAAIRHIIFWTAPAIALFIVLRAHLVRVVLGSGAFSWEATKLTAAILAAFAVSLIAQAAILVFSRAYYAAGKESAPILVNVGIALIAGVGAFWGLVWFQDATVARYFIEGLFRVEGVPGTGALVIVLIYSAITLVGASLFGYLFAKDFGFERRVFATLFCSVSSAIVGAAVAYATLQVFGPLLPTETFVGIFTQGIVAGFMGLLAWGATLFILRSREFAETVTIVARLVGRKNHAEHS